MQSIDFVPKDLFYRSKRPNDSRLGEWSQPVTLAALKSKNPGFALLGYPDDEGISLNFGRVGSREAPNSIRAALYKMASGSKKFPALYDVGNFQSTSPLVVKQAEVIEVVKNVYSFGHRLVTLGGGHDYAYPDGQAFLAGQKKRPLIINIDAHLDMRDPKNGPNSGTAFQQLLNSSKNFDLVQIGIQPFANTEYFFNLAKKFNVKVVTFEQAHGQLKKIFRALGKAQQPTFLSIDIDGFSSAFAPGCSAANPIGLDALEFVSALPDLASRLNILGMGIYEVSPPLDLGHSTSQLAAAIIHAFLLASA